MSQATIRKAFEIPLAAWAASQSLPIAWENVPFTPPATTAFVEVSLIPARTASDTLDGTDRRYTGLFQVSLVMPIDSGAGEAEALAQSLDAVFPISTRLFADGVEVVIMQPMSAAPAINRPENFVIPVSCQYRAQIIS